MHVAMRYASQVTPFALGLCLTPFKTKLFRSFLLYVFYQRILRLCCLHYRDHAWLAGDPLECASMVSFNYDYLSTSWPMTGYIHINKIRSLASLLLRRVIRTLYISIFQLWFRKVELPFIFFSASHFTFNSFDIPVQ